MIVRVRLRKGPPVKRKRGKNRHLALAGGALLIPASLMAYALGAWGLASDMGAAGNSGVQGIFSHWQVWVAAGARVAAFCTGAQYAARALLRARDRDFAGRMRLHAREALHLDVS